MSMITGCPACGTMFKVVADQLKISDGWVRCGQCAEIFEATAHMQAEARSPVLQAPVPARQESVVAIPGRILNPSEARAGAPTLIDTQPDELSAPASDFKPSSPLTPWQTPSGFGTSSQPAEEPSYLPVHLVRAEAEAAAARIDSLDDDDDPGDDQPLRDVAFVREARRKASWGRPRVRFALLLALLALAGLLALQVAVQERDRLASLQPGAVPLLLQVCESLGCRIGPPKRIDAIAIDSSGFTKLRPDAYRLNFTLKNSAALPVAVPALELTLTDSQDQPLLRRVLTARELGAPSDTIASSGEWSSSVAIAVAGGASNRVAGYRLLAFYP